MEASFLPKVQGQGGKQKEHGHSLLFDSAMADKVLRLNAYEDRLLSKRTEHIERQKQQSLEEHNFCKSQFLLRFSPVVKRQNELKRQFLSKVFDSEDISDKPVVTRNRPLSSYPNMKSRTSTASLNEKAKPVVRRTMSAELRFPALQESMDDILNGYRTYKPQIKSVSPTKMRFRGNWIMESHKYDDQSRNEILLPKTITPEKKSRFKRVDFDIVKAMENTEQLTDTFTFGYPKLSKGELAEIFPTDSIEKNPNRTPTKFVFDDDNTTTQQEATVTSESSEQAITWKNQGKKPIKSAKKSNEDRSGVANKGSSNLFPKQLKMFQNDKLPEELLKNLIHSLNNDATASKTARFLAKMLSTEGSDSLDNPSSVVPLQCENAAGIHLLSDVKKRQRYEAQRLRIMRTFVLAYDSVWNERAKKISTAA